MGRVNNPQKGEIQLVNRSKQLGRLAQPLSFARDAIDRDVFSPQAELARAYRNINATRAAGDRMPLTGQQRDFVDIALGAGKNSARAGDMATHAVMSAEQRKRLKVAADNAERLGQGFMHDTFRARLDQQMAEAKQAAKNQKKAAVHGAVGTAAGGALAAYANKPTVPGTTGTPATDAATNYSANLPTNQYSQYFNQPTTSDYFKEPSVSDYFGPTPAKWY